MNNVYGAIFVFAQVVIYMTVILTDLFILLEALLFLRKMRGGFALATILFSAIVGFFWVIHDDPFSTSVLIAAASGLPPVRLIQCFPLKAATQNKTSKVYFGILCLASLPFALWLCVFVLFVTAKLSGNYID